MRKIRMTPVRLLVLGFLAIIAAGTCLLLLPVSTRSGESPAFMDALFTAVTSTCVTGLVTQDTYSHWSTFGHVVILVLIQTGGIGFMTVVFALWKLGGKKISLKERAFMQESVAAPNLSGMVKLTGTILLGTFLSVRKSPKLLVPPPNLVMRSPSRRFRSTAPCGMASRSA